VGKSKAVLVEQKTQQFQRAVFFTLLNPQPNGAGFAGIVNRKASYDLSAFTGLKWSVRAQGENFIYKVLLRHHNEESSLQPSYEIFFEVNKRKTAYRSIDLFQLVAEKYYDRTVFIIR
jgi:NADH dehydrogenase [ubiquinone] 1 alpha subcomplex assembly factor 1